MNLNIKSDNSNEHGPDSSPSSPLTIIMLKKGVTTADVDSIFLDLISMEGSVIFILYSTNNENHFSKQFVNHFMTYQATSKSEPNSSASRTNKAREGVRNQIQQAQKYHLPISRRNSQILRYQYQQTKATTKIAKRPML